MKAYVIVKEDTKIQFAWHDDEFLQRLLHLCQNQEAVVQLSNVPLENRDCIQQLLSPIIVAYSLLRTKFDDSCSIISCKKVGCEIIFQQHGELLYLGFCNISEVSQYEMKKELYVLYEMIKFLFGPCRQNINPTEHIERNWGKLTEALHSFNRLYQNEPSFLVGCIESLHVNEDVKSRCTTIVDKQLKTLAKQLERERIAFGFLFVRNKLLTYGVGGNHKHEVTTEDLLRILIIINSNYKEIEDPSSSFEASSAADAFDLPYSDATIEPSDSTEVEGEETESGTTPVADDNQFVDEEKALPVPVPTIQITPAVDEVFLCSDEEEMDPVERIHKARNQEKLQHSHSDSILGSFTGATGQNFRPKLDNLSGSNENATKSSSLNVIQSRKERYSTGSKNFPTLIPEVAGRDFLDEINHNDIHTYPVFLHTTLCRLTPFLMHNVRIADGVTFVVLSEMKGGDVASIICKLLKALGKIKIQFDLSVGVAQKATVNVQGDQETIDKLTQFYKQLKLRLRSQRSDQKVNSIFELWEKQISKLLSTGWMQLTADEIVKLEKAIEEFVANLRSLFSRLFLIKPNKCKSAWRVGLAALKIKMQERLKDYYDFLIVKAYKNVAISWTQDKYPGLLHFTIIRRSMTKSGVPGMMKMNEVFTSTSHQSNNDFINKIDSEENTNIDLVTLLKRQVWKGIFLAYSMVNGKDGVNKFMAIDGDFYFSSFFSVEFIENQSFSQHSANSLANLNLTWTGKTTHCGVGSPFRSIFPSSYVASSRFYELHLIHFSTVPEQMVNEQKEKLWKEISEQLM